MLSRLGAADSSLWIEFIMFCNRFRSFEKVEKLFARGIRLHPAVIPLWLLAAAHEFHVNGSVDAARVLLQRGIRLNANATKLWVELFRLELLYVDKVRARRSVLGISDDADLPDDDDDVDDNADVVTETTTGKKVGLYDEDSEEESDDGLASDDDKFYSRVSKAREKRLKRRREAEAANAPSACARAVARRAFLDGALALIVWRRAIALFPRDHELRIELLRVATIFPFVHQIVDQGVEQFEADFGADADALSALCELLCTATRATETTTTTATLVPPQPWRSWRDGVQLLERAIVRAKQESDADDRAANVAPTEWVSSALRSALLQFVLARVRSGAVEMPLHVVLTRLANDESILDPIQKFSKKSARNNDGGDNDDAAVPLLQHDELRFSVAGYVSLAQALLRCGKLSLAASALQQLVDSASYGTIRPTERDEVSLLLAAINASVARSEQEDSSAVYRAGVMTLRTIEPMSLALVHKEFLALLDGVLDADGDNDDDNNNDALSRALVFYEEVMLQCPRDVAAISRFQVCCINGLAARQPFEAVARFFDKAASYPPVTAAMRERYVGMAITHGKLGGAQSAKTTRRVFEAAVQAEPGNVALWDRWLQFETDHGDVSRCGEIQWRKIAALG
jgi:hypothetical protein